ncbi:MAG: hypothetical protein OEW34_03500 [Burkholderiaceae bacterium]|jgi:hypothetical protein|nr:hypothetical protein [Burkholderiaceae bacterium]
MSKRMTAALTALLIGLAGASSAMAEELTAGDWKFHAQVYGWFPSISGSTTFPPSDGGGSANIDLSNYMDALQFAFMGGLDVRKGKLGVLTDFIYLNFDANESATRELTLSSPGGRIEIPVDVTANVRAGLRGWSWTLAGTYSAVEKPGYEMQVLGGLRYLKVDTTLSWNLNGNIGSLPPVVINGAVTSKPDWWDAIVGVRGRAQLGQGRWFVPYYADVGTGQSDLTWQAVGGLGYAFSWGEVVGAYRRMDYRFDSSSPLRDLSFSGPALSLGFRW